MARPGDSRTLTILIQAQIEALRRMTVRELRGRYHEVFGEESRSNHKQFLFRRIAWRLQADAEGGLSERARQRAMEIANDGDLSTSWVDWPILSVSGMLRTASCNLAANPMSIDASLLCESAACLVTNSESSPTSSCAFCARGY